MSEYEKYLAERLQQLKAMCDQSIRAYKSYLQQGQNRNLNYQVQEAERKMNETRDACVESFRRSMAELEAMRKKDGHVPAFKRMYDRVEISHKKTLETKLRAAANIWGSLINYLKSNVR